MLLARMLDRRELERLSIDATTFSSTTSYLEKWKQRHPLAENMPLLESCWSGSGGSVSENHFRGSNRRPMVAGSEASSSRSAHRFESPDISSPVFGQLGSVYPFLRRPRYVPHLWSEPFTSMLPLDGPKEERRATVRSAPGYSRFDDLEGSRCARAAAWLRHC